MKKTKKNFIAKFAAFAMIAMVTLASCKKDKTTEVTPDPVVTPDALKTTYTLNVKDVLGVTGTVTFAEVSSGSTNSVVTIKLVGAPASTHPAHIHMNSAIETGGIAYALTDVDAAGNSSTILPISYGGLIAFDGYVNVHLDAATLGTIVAQGDIGGNVFTGNTKSYTLLQDSTTGISGVAKFDQRKNGNTLVTVDLTSGGILPGGMYPAQINLGSVTTIGSPVVRRTLNPVNGTSRLSITNVRTLNDGAAITYDNWLVYDGFLSVHDAANVSNIIALGNIGAH